MAKFCIIFDNKTKVLFAFFGGISSTNFADKGDAIAGQKNLKKITPPTDNFVICSSLNFESTSFESIFDTSLISLKTIKIIGVLKKLFFSSFSSYKGNKSTESKIEFRISSTI